MSMMAFQQSCSVTVCGVRCQACGASSRQRVYTLRGVYSADLISISESLIIYTPVHYSNLTGFIYTTWNKNKIKF